MKQELLTVAEVARVTGYHPVTVRQMSQRGVVRSIKRGRDWFIYSDQVARLKERFERNVTRAHIGKVKPLFKEDHANHTAGHDK